MPIIKPTPKKKLPSYYDVLDLISLLDRVAEEAIKKQESKFKEKPFDLTSLPAWGSEYAFKVTSLVTCLRQAAYEALGVKGLPRTKESWRYGLKGTFDHYRFGQELKNFFIAKESAWFDPEYHIIGHPDFIVPSLDLKTLLVVDFKGKRNYGYRQILRKNIRSHLRGTRFYPAEPDHEMQVQLYIYLCRLWKLDIVFGIIVYEDWDDPNNRKICLVEYDEKLVQKFLVQVAELEEKLKRKELPEPYIPKESFVHLHCPFRLKCPRGQEALHLTEKERRKKIPYWVLIDLKRRAKQPVPEIEEQQKLFGGEK